MKKYVLTGVLSLVLVWMPAVVVSAQGNSDREARPSAQERRELVQQRVQEKREAIKQRVEERKAEVRERVCEQREAVLQRTMPRLATNATTLKTKIDAIYERVQGFYEDGQLTVVNYGELTEAVDTAQADAEAAIVLVDEYEFEFDCEENGVGQQLDGFRDAIADARDELKVYRSALVDLISSMRAEAATDEAEETENENEEPEDEDEEEVENEDEDSEVEESNNEEETNETQ